MVHAPPSPAANGQDAPRRLTPAILVSVSALLSLLTRKAGQVSKKLKANHCNKNRNKHDHYYFHSDGYMSVEEFWKPPATPRRTPLAHRPKELLTHMSNKAIKLVHGRKKGGAVLADDDGEDRDFGDGGVWQRAILMGDKCQPLEFSGVIYYDENGKKINQLPIRSPRASPMPGYLTRRNF